ncbi:hypothetical protein QBC43DRAFT_221064 [Cladorrhinum sp. PSN259]|nr:hypothetical protein QBC43DRAFT_221064 [Cladorrhinum sp. PSN259]
MLSTETVTDRETTLAARYQAVGALQERLNNPALSTLDETIAQAVKLASNDLCYGETQDLRVHIHGVQQMTRLRGGLQSLGMNGTLAKMVIITDKIISIALELPPLYSPSEITTYLPRFLPSITSAPTNSSPATTTPTTLPEGLDEATSALLKDITFLVDTVLALPASPSEWELSKVVTMSNWVYGRLHTPSSPTSTSGVSSTTSSAMHQSIRLAALLYCRAIQARKPLSQVVGEQDVVEIVDAVWKVPLEVWNGTRSNSDGQVGRVQGQGKGQGQGLLGTLVWTLAGILPVAKGMEGAYTTKTMMMAAAVQEAMRRSDRLEGENGNGLGVIGVLERIGRLQRWLEGGQGMMLQASSNSGPSKRGGSGSPGLGGQA